MPFTPTHILAVLPIAAWWRWLPLSGLAIGSMIPDLPLFVPFAPAYQSTHSLTGLFTVCLPLGFGAFLLFECFVKTPVVSLLPFWVQARLNTRRLPYEMPSSSYFASVAVAVLIGTATHVVWDAFTHQGRWGTNLVPALNSSTTILGQNVAGYKLLQYGSSFAGLPLLTAMSLLWLRGNTPTEVNTLYPFTRRAKLLAGLAAFAIPVAVTTVVLATSTDNPYVNLGRVIKTTGLVAISTILIYSLIFHCATKGRFGLS